MALSLLLPATVLIGVMFAAAVVLLLDTRAQRLARRIATVGPGAALVQAEARPSIRVASRQRAPIRDALRAVLQVPIDIPAAHVMPVGMVAACGMVGGVVVAWLAQVFVAAPLALGLGIAAGLLLVRGLFKWERQRYGGLLRRQMPDMIELQASSVRAGLPVAEAFNAAARELPLPTRGEFGRVVREMALGTPAETALMALHRRTGVAEYAIFAVTLGVQARTGGRLSETIHLLAETIRQRIALAGRAAALAAEAKLSASVLSVLPFLGGALMAATQKNYLQPLLHDPRGQHMVVIGLSLLVLGQFTMRWFIASATRD